MYVYSEHICSQYRNSWGLLEFSLQLTSYHPAGGLLYPIFNMCAGWYLRLSRYNSAAHRWASYEVYFISAYGRFILRVYPLFSCQSC